MVVVSMPHWQWAMVVPTGGTILRQQPLHPGLPLQTYRREWSTQTGTQGCRLLRPQPTLHLQQQPTPRRSRPVRANPYASCCRFLERNVPVLARRSFFALVNSGSEGADDPASELGWLENIVNETPLSGHVGVVELVLVVGDKPLTSSLRIRSLADLLRENDLAAPSAPITAISADGRANTKSAPRSRHDIAMYAPPYALRRITVTLGTVHSEKA